MAGRLLAVRVRREAIKTAIEGGLSRARAVAKLRTVSDDKIMEVAEAAAAARGLKLPRASELAPRGGILKAIGDFFRANPELLQAIVAILLSLI